MQNKYLFTKDKKRVKFFSFTFFADYYDSDGDGVPSVEDNLVEIETIMKEGYITSLFIYPSDTEEGFYKFKKVVELCKKYGVNYWMSAGVYKSQNETQEAYLEGIYKKCDIMKSVEGAWDLFLGFYWDEPFNKRMKNDEFLAVTRDLYLKYRKRIYPCFSTNTLNDRVIEHLGMTGIMEVPTTEALKYVTDVGGNNYSYDIRESALDNEMQNERFAELSEAYGAEINTADDYYKYVTNEIVRKFDHPVNIWYYPCAYNAEPYTYEECDEAYCVAQTKYFENLLEEATKDNDKKFAGGLCFFTYNSRIFTGLAKYLPIKINSEMMCKEEGFENKWYDMDRTIKDIVKKYESEGETTLYAGLDLE